uniref:Uncharacterized protein n=1 Tax=Anguilla anguilla TaxID=7936 RepID=A0A0E9X7Y9_ANGAN
MILQRNTWMSQVIHPNLLLAAQKLLAIVLQEKMPPQLDRTTYIKGEEISEMKILTFGFNESQR